MQIIDGKQIAQKIIDELKSRSKPEKIFAAILVGDNPQSESFLKQKEKVAKELGIDFRLYKLPEPAGGYTNDFLRKEIGKIALLKRVGGIIVQLPLPEHLNRHYILNVIPREKDVDVLGERALGAFYTDRNLILPPAIGVIKEILKEPAVLFEKSVSEAERAWFPSEARKSEAESQGASERLGERDPVFSKIKPLAIAIVGAGFLIGKPIAVWLMNPTLMYKCGMNQKVKELTIFEKGDDLSELKNYDLIISGTGIAGLIKPEMLKQGAGIIDFGYSMGKELGIMNNELGIKIHGDFDVSNIHNSKFMLHNSSFYTPTPGGTGLILVAKVFENFYDLNKNESHT